MEHWTNRGSENHSPLFQSWSQLIVGQFRFRPGGCRGRYQEARGHRNRYQCIWGASTGCGRRGLRAGAGELPRYIQNQLQVRKCSAGCLKSVSQLGTRTLKRVNHQIDLRLCVTVRQGYCQLSWALSVVITDCRKENVLKLWNYLLELLRARRTRLELSLQIQRIFQVGIWLRFILVVIHCTCLSDWLGSPVASIAARIVQRALPGLAWQLWLVASAELLVSGRFLFGF